MKDRDANGRFVKGHIVSDDTGRKIGEAQLGVFKPSVSVGLKKYFSDPANRQKVRDKQLELHDKHPEMFDSFATATKMRKQGLLPKPSGMTGKKQTEEAKRKIGIASKRSWKDSEYRIKVVASVSATVRDQIHRDRTSCRMKNQWQIPEYRHKVLDRRGKSKPEERFEFICKKHALTYSFVGNGVLMVGRMIPDFVHESKNKIIEIWGEYFHKGQDPQKRIDRLREFGYDALVLWASELRCEDKIVARVKEFEEVQYES